MFALRQADTGVAVAEVCRKMGISEATYYNWKKKYGGLGVPELRRLKQLEKENQHLKQLVADLSLDKQMLQDVLKQRSKARSASHAAQYLIDAYRISARRACRVVVLQRSSWCYKAHRRDDTVLRQRLRELAQVRIRYGCQRLFTLLRREGWVDNHQRVHRLSCLQGLNLRSKRPKRNWAAAHRLERGALQRPPQSWHMDFVADHLFDGHKIRALTIVDKYSRQCLAIHVGQSLKGEDVVAVMTRLQQVPPALASAAELPPVEAKRIATGAAEDKVDVVYALLSADGAGLNHPVLQPARRRGLQRAQQRTRRTVQV